MPLLHPVRRLMVSFSYDEILPRVLFLIVLFCL